MTDCAVVIVNYNAGALLVEAARSALESGASELVVVDNASTDDSLARLEHAVGNEVTILRNDVNLGFAAGCNAGIRGSSAASILFLNPDARLGTASLARLHQVLWSAPSIGMVGPRLLNPDGSEQRGGRRRIPTVWSGFSFGLVPRFVRRRVPRFFPEFNQNELSLPDSPVDVEAISGSCMMVRRSAVDKVGLWDEGYFLHVEDVDYCMRFGRADLRIVFVPDAVAVHVKGASSRARPIRVEWHKHRGMMRFYDKFLAPRQSLPVTALVKSGILLRFVLVCAGTTLDRLRAGQRRDAPR